MESPGLPAEPRTPRATLTPELIGELSSFGNRVRFTAGTTVFQHGEPGETMFVVEKGEIGLVFEQGKPGKKLGPGAFFGELALLTGRRPRTATALATQDTVLRELNQATFDELLRGRPALLAVLLVQTCAYLLESEQQLIADLKRRNVDLEQSLDYLRRMKQELDIAELRAQTDQLTGLYNRRCLEMQIPAVIQRARESNSELAVVLVDLDRFKEINDAHGHHVGDMVLRQTAGVVKASVRQTDLPFRIGGDEFLVVMPGIGRSDALRRAEHILHALAGFTADLPHVVATTPASIGLTMFRPDDSWESAFCRVDGNLYRAKSAGGNRITLDKDD